MGSRLGVALVAVVVVGPSTAFAGRNCDGEIVPDQARVVLAAVDATQPEEAPSTSGTAVLLADASQTLGAWKDSVTGLFTGQSGEEVARDRAVTEKMQGCPQAAIDRITGLGAISKSGAASAAEYVLKQDAGGIADLCNGAKVKAQLDAFLNDSKQRFATTNGPYKDAAGNVNPKWTQGVLSDWFAARSECENDAACFVHDQLNCVLNPDACKSDPEPEPEHQTRDTVVHSPVTPRSGDRYRIEMGPRVGGDVPPSVAALFQGAVRTLGQANEEWRKGNDERARELCGQASSTLETANDVHGSSHHISCD